VDALVEATLPGVVQVNKGGLTWRHIMSFGRGMM